MASLLVLCSLAVAAAPATASPPSEHAVELTISSLLANMTVPEKARQLMIQDVSIFLTNGEFDSEKAAAYLSSVGAGKIDSYGRNVDPILGNQIQKAILQSSAHGIGGLFSEECEFLTTEAPILQPPAHTS